MTADSDSRLRQTCAGSTSLIPDLEALPSTVTELLVAYDAAPRLAAHLRAVFDTAVQLTAALKTAFPAFVFDAEAVTFGAAIHDIGKVRHPAELVGPGARHESDGEQLLLESTIPAELARFARTHAAWADSDMEPDDLLVALADKVWKGRRQEDLEQRIVERISASTGTEAWEVFMVLDEILSRIAEQADARLAYQNQFAG